MAQSGEPNYLLRLGLIAGSMFVGFTLIIVSGWSLIYNPGNTETWLIWSLRRLPLALGIVLLAAAFILLRKPVEDDPFAPQDDVDNMDGA